MNLTNPECISLVVAVSLLVAAAGGCSPTGPAVDRMVEKREAFNQEPEWKAQWREADYVLPPYPSDANLIEVQIEGPKSFKFFLDAQSIAVYDDAVVRYTLVARSPSGSDNVTFEGMRCETGEYKSYAFGSTERTWTQSRNAEWYPIRDLDRNKIRHSLYRFYVCPYGVPQRDASRVVAALKRGIPMPAGR